MHESVRPRGPVRQRPSLGARSDHHPRKPAFATRAVHARMTHCTTAGSPFGVDSSLLRLSVGLEGCDELIADLEHAWRLSHYR